MHGYGTVKKFNRGCWKVCRLSNYSTVCRSKSKKGTVNDKKLLNNLYRARASVFELIMCNEWEYWCTFTIDQSKFDRFDLKTYYAAFSQFIRNQNKKESSNIKYIFVPEKHKNGAWHIHGCISGIAPDQMKVNSMGYLTWTKYQEKFGFISMSAIKNIEAVAKYTMKYMTKEAAKNVTELGQHIFYASKGLKRAEETYKGQITLKRVDIKYDYVEVSWCKSEREVNSIVEAGYLKETYDNSTAANILHLLDEKAAIILGGVRGPASEASEPQPLDG